MNYFYGVICGFLLFSLVIYLNIQLVKYLRRRSKQKYQLNVAEEKEVLDNFQKFFQERLDGDFPFPEGVPEGVLERQHRGCLILKQKDVDIKTALLTPRVLMHYDWGTKHIQLNLYIEIFFRGDGSTEEFYEQADFPKDQKILAVSKALELYENGFYWPEEVGGMNDFS